MNPESYRALCAYRDEVKAICEELTPLSPKLKSLASEASKTDTPEYPLEHPVVYNRDYDTIAQESSIRLIVIGDNPGKEEQMEKNCRYLVGQSGRVAEGFFRRNSELGIDFRANTLITNKTPIHTAKTAHLKKLIQNGGQDIQNAIETSQREMAQATARLHRQMLASGEAVQLFLVGYAELKPKGIFSLYRDTLASCYEEDKEAWNHVLVFQHFSMNRFLVDLKQNRTPEEQLEAAITRLGTRHRQEIFGY